MAWWERAKPGDKIVCVQEVERAFDWVLESGLTACAPIKGHVYTIKTINHWPSKTLLTVHELDNSHFLALPCCGVEPGINAEFFRPVERRKTDISVFTDILRSCEQERQASLEVSI